jgi:hypothetical protein
MPGLIERLAKNNHDLWAQKRLAEGWRYGRHRDDARKETPLLVPYEDLPESEKQLDRDMVTQMFKALLAMGYRLSR